MRRITIATIVLAMLSSGCAGTVGRPDLVRQKLTNNYVGQNIEFVIERLGAPDSILKLESGKTVYTWKRQTNKYNKNSLIMSDERCVITMITDKNGKNIEKIGKVDDSLGGWRISYCAEQLGL